MSDPLPRRLSRVEAISAYRDALLRDAPAAELARIAAALDPETARLLQLFRAAQREVEGAPPAFVARLERDLTRSFDQSWPVFSPSREGHSDSANGRIPIALETTKPLIDLPQWRRGAVTHWATAALILLTLLGAFIVYRATAPSREPAMLTGGDEPMIETMLDATLEGLPDAPTPLTVERWTFQPGPAELSLAAQNGPQWIVADGSPFVATIAGEERRLEPGVGFVVPPDIPVVLRNSAAGEAALYRGSAAAGFALEEYDRTAIAKSIALDSEASETLPPGTSRVLFERVTLPPGAGLMVEDATGHNWLQLVKGDLGMTLRGDALPNSWRSGHEREIALGDPMPFLVPGTGIWLRNIGEGPLVILRLSVTPLADDGENAATRG